MSDSIETDNKELVTPRDLVREFAGRMEQLTSGEVEKLVLVKRSQMIAVVIPFEKYAHFERLQEEANNRGWK